MPHYPRFPILGLVAFLWQAAPLNALNISKLRFLRDENMAVYLRKLVSFNLPLLLQKKLLCISYTIPYIGI